MSEYRSNIGKDVIDSLTQSMYDDCRDILREYIQNSADAIDKAKKQKLEKDEDYAISIDIDDKSIRICDNGIGIPSETAKQYLINVGRSAKVRGEDKGFRGIGRLAGLSYCRKLTFETSAKGENVKTIME